MIELIYKRPVESANEGNLILKDFECKINLLRSSNEGSDLALILTDPETNEIIEETLTVQGLIPSIEGLKDYLLKLDYFYEKVLK